MKKLLYITGIITAMSLSVTGCGSTETAEPTEPNAVAQGGKAEGGEGMERPEGMEGEGRGEGMERPEGMEGEGRGEGMERPEGMEGEAPQNTVVGKITEIFGNEISLQVGALNQENAMMSSGQGGEQNTEMMAERQAQGGGGGQNSEMMAERQAQGGGGGQNSEMMAERQAQGGGGGGMSAIMSSGTDFSEMVDLTDEVLTMTIPVSTPVTQMGVDMTFSQLTKDTYISVTTGTDGTILRVNVLG